MTGNTKEPSINLIKGSFVLLFKERAPIALPSILISKIGNMSVNIGIPAVPNDLHAD